MLDADRVHVEPVVAGVERDVAGRYQLGDLTVGGVDEVMRRHPAARPAKGAHRRGVGLLSVVDHDVADVVAVAEPIGPVVVAVGVRVTRDRLAVGSGDEMTHHIGRALEATVWLTGGSRAEPRSSAPAARSPSPLATSPSATVVSSGPAVSSPSAPHPFQASRRADPHPVTGVASPVTRRQQRRRSCQWGPGFPEPPCPLTDGLRELECRWLCVCGTRCASCV